jgi:hypothetical protein
MFPKGRHTKKLCDDEVTFNLNGAPTQFFPIYRKVRQGCFSAHLFLLVEKAMNQVIKAKVNKWYQRFVVSSI